jgi:hypothetical protein
MIINNNALRSCNLNFTPVSGSHTLFVVYSIRWTYPTTLMNNFSGVAFLETSIDGGTTWEQVSRVESGLKVALSVTLGMELTTTTILSGFIKPDAVIRIRTEGVIPFIVNAQETVID